VQASKRALKSIFLFESDVDHRERCVRQDAEHCTLEGCVPKSANREMNSNTNFLRRRAVLAL
jgi:hypothetical protein